MLYFRPCRLSRVTYTSVMLKALRPAQPTRPTSYLVAKGGQIDGGPAASFQSPFSTFAYISHVMISLSNSVGELFTKMAHMRIYLVVGVPARPHFDLVLPVKLHIPASLPAGQPFIFGKPIAVASCIRSLTFLREIVSLELRFAACDAWPIFYCTEGAQTSTSAWGLDHSGPQQKEDPDLVFRALTQIVLTNTSRCLVQGRTIIQWKHVSVQLWLRRMVESCDCSDAASHWRPRCQAYKTHSNSMYFWVACWHESRT